MARPRANDYCSTALRDALVGAVAKSGKLDGLIVWPIKKRGGRGAALRRHEQRKAAAQAGQPDYL